MAEESENSGGGSLKGILIGLASTVALGVGGYVTKQLTGEKDEPAAAVTAPAPVINILLFLRSSMLFVLSISIPYTY